MQGNSAVAESPAPTFDLISMYPGSIEGGADQIIIDIVPKIIGRPEVRAWAFERTTTPVNAVTLLLDLEPGAIDDVIDVCEEMLSSRLRDDPSLTIQPLVETPVGSRGGDAPWGVNHASTRLSSGDAQVRRQVALEQAVSAVALRVLTNVREIDWDRKSIAPSLLLALLARLAAGRDPSALAFGIMQALIANHPDAEALTRQFRMKSYQLAKAGTTILLQGDDAVEFERELAAALDALGAEFQGREVTGADTVSAAVWRRLAAGIGFSDVEAAYIACLASAAMDGKAA